MANVQSVVGLIPALGVAGQQVVVGQAEYLGYVPLSDGTVKAGTFCFKKTNSGTGEAFALASLLGGAATDEPLGFVERVVDTRIDGANAATDVYPEGAALTVAIRGQYYITAGATVSADGLGVFINPLTGAISIASSAGTGEVDTGWVCRIPNGGTSAASGDLVIVERF